MSSVNQIVTINLANEEVRLFNVELPIQDLRLSHNRIFVIVGQILPLGVINHCQDWASNIS
jgi:hypothetical protein